MGKIPRGAFPKGSPSRGGDVVKDINRPSLPTPFYSVLVSVSVFMPLSTVFHSINSRDKCPFSHSVLLVLNLPAIGPVNCISLYESYGRACEPVWPSGKALGW